MLYYKANGRKEIRGHHAPENTSGRVGLTGPSPVLASKSPPVSPPALPAGVQANLAGRESMSSHRSQGSRGSNGMGVGARISEDARRPGTSGGAVRKPDGNWI